MEYDSYLQLVVDPNDLDNLKELLLGKEQESDVFANGCPVAKNSHCGYDHCRLLNLDPLLENCPSAAFTKNQNPYWRSPGMLKKRLKYVLDPAKMFVDTSNRTRDLWVISNSGHNRLTPQITESLTAFFDDKQAPRECYIFPKEVSLQVAAISAIVARRLFAGAIVREENVPAHHP